MRPSLLHRLVPRLPSAGFLLVATGLTAVSAGAQGTVLTGLVKDDRGLPVPGASVAVRGNAMRTMTDDAGAFRLVGVPVGLTYVSARGPGVLPAVELLRVTPDDTLEFVLERLHPNEDTTRIVRAAERAFERDVARYAAATAAARTAVSFTDRDIAERSPSVTTELFRLAVGFSVVGDGSAAVVVTKGYGCRPNVFVDGQEMVPGFNLNEIRPTTIKLLLAYNSFAILPAALRSLRVDQRCGAVSIITR
jgi:Carboxypeptidase regulatory-like domain